MKVLQIINTPLLWELFQNMRARASIVAQESLDNWEKMYQKMLFSQCLNFLIINENSKKVVYKESYQKTKVLFIAF